MSSPEDDLLGSLLHAARDEHVCGDLEPAASGDEDGTDPLDVAMQMVGPDNVISHVADGDGANDEDDEDMLSGALLQLAQQAPAPDGVDPGHGDGEPPLLPDNVDDALAQGRQLARLVAKHIIRNAGDQPVEGKVQAGSSRYHMYHDVVRQAL